MNERVGLIGTNSIEFIELLLKIWEEGNTACIFDWRMPIVEIENQMKNAGIEHCYVPDNMVPSNNENFVYIKYKITEHKCSELPTYIYELYKENYSHKEAIILYSSGTTGDSKGIVLSHFALNTNADMINKCIKPQKDECIFLVKPVSHSSSLVTGIIFSLKFKIRLVISNPTLPPTMNLKNINDYDATIVMINPSLLKLFVLAQSNHNISFKTLKCIRVSGSRLSKDLLDDAKKNFKGVEILNGYGLTETGPAIAMQRSGDKTNVDTSVGKALEGVKIKINRTTNGNVGQILVKTPCLFEKYIISNTYKKNETSEWFNTGDLGKLDEFGNLFVEGRQDNMLIVGGHNVYPEAIEKKLLDNFIEIEECVIVGKKDSLFGDKIILYYKSKNNIDKSIKEYFKNNFAKYEQPLMVHKIDSMPINLNGKISRKFEDYKFNE